jgi:putative thioredoxin
VVLFFGGQVVDQFTGALPEGQVRAFLDKHLKPPVSPVDQLREAGAGDPTPPRRSLLRQALALQPGHGEATLDLAERVMAAVRSTTRARCWTACRPSTRNAAHEALMVKRIELAANRRRRRPTALAARIAANPKDFEARFALAAIQAYEGDFNAAFDQLLEVVLRDKAELAREGPPAAGRVVRRLPDAEAVGMSRGRRYLGMYLN